MRNRGEKVMKADGAPVLGERPLRVPFGDPLLRALQREHGKPEMLKPPATGKSTGRLRLVETGGR